jgi:anti-sigma B factor antagonist
MANHQSQNRTAVISLPAEIDAINADHVGSQLLAAFGPGITTVIADMTGTTFCDSSGIRVLLQAHQQARANHAELVLVVASAGVLRVLELTGLDVLLPIYPTLAEAMAARATADTRSAG